MKIALAQLNYHIGNFEANSKKIIDAIETAKKANAELIVFSELAVCGYPPYDLLERKEFVTRCIEAIHYIANHCKGIAAIVGGPDINPDETGKKLFNTAYFLKDQAIFAKTHKTLLPNYDVFDEYRYFESNETFNLVEFGGKKIAITICEDLWDEQPVANSFGRNKLYKKSPSEALAQLKPDLLINLSASPFSYTKTEVRAMIVQKKATVHQLPIIYVNQTGANTELIFDGNSMVVNQQGVVVKQLPAFQEAIDYITLEEIEHLKPAAPNNTDPIALIHDALVCGIQDYFAKTGFRQATLGLSGGIDSAVTLALAEKALGHENLKVLLLPSKYSSSHSVSDAVKLAQNLNIDYEIVPIREIVESFDDTLAPLFEDRKPDVTEENIQARIRGVLLMALSNKFGHILLNTSNKSEAAVGYGTLYGDMNGGLSVLGDVYKSDVFKLAWYINREQEIIPENTITKAPSAELRPDQKDSDSLPDYAVLDRILFHYIELNQSAQEIAEAGYDMGIVQKVIRMVNNNEYKRFQSPPILRVSSKAFGSGRRIPLVAKQ